jgi:cis-3-alkyl-4-acyloxetan-2-one decarboxylase
LKTAGDATLSTGQGWRAEYPFASHGLAVGSDRLHYLDEGQGEVLLALHGNPTWSFYWRKIITALRDRYRLVAPDHLGCGLSDKPRTAPYTLAQHIGNVVRLVDHLDLRNVTLLAHDWGGAIGLGALLARRERFARIVLLNTAAFPGPLPWRIGVCRWPLLGPLVVRGLNGFARAALSQGTGHREGLSKTAREGLLAPYGNWRDRVAILRFVQDIPTSPAHPSWIELDRIVVGLPTLAELPSLLVWGMRDWCFTPWFLDQFCAVWPRAETFCLYDAGHYVVEDAHERMVPRLVEFLRRNPVEIAETTRA